MSKRSPTVIVHLARKEVRSQLGRNILAHKLAGALELTREAEARKSDATASQAAKTIASVAGSFIGKAMILDADTQKPIGKAMLIGNAPTAKPAKQEKPREMTANEMQNAAQLEYDQRRSLSGKQLVSPRKMRRIQR